MTFVSPMHLHLYVKPSQRKFGCRLRLYLFSKFFRFTLNTLFDPASAMFSKHSWCFLLLTCANVRDLSHAAHTTRLEDSWEAQPDACVHHVHHVFVQGFWTLFRSWICSLEHGYGFLGNASKITEIIPCCNPLLNWQVRILEDFFSSPQAPEKR